MLKDDFEVFIDKIEASFRPNFEALQEAVLQAAEDVKTWLSNNPTVYLQDFESGDIVPPQCWQIYLKCKETLKKAVDMAEVS